ncbi:LuxR family transcriptional regulator, partial [Streptosporangium canum]
MDLSSFVGRAEELAEGLQHLAGARLLTLTGPAGVGKTRTALRLADTLRRGFTGGVWRVELSGTADPAATVAETLEAGGALSPPEIASALGDRRLLVVLDTCEHLLGEVTALVEALLGRASRIVVVATSRQPLGLPGERVLGL